MHYAAAFGRTAMIQILNDQEALVNATFTKSFTPLHLAVTRGFFKAVQLLLKLGAHQVASTQGGYSLLIEAYLANRADIVHVLEQAQGIESQRVTPSRGYDHIAKAMQMIQKGDVKTYERILALGCPVNLELDFSQGDHVWRVTPLMVAVCVSASVKVVQLLMERGADVSIKYDPPIRGSFYTVLHAAIANPVYNHILPRLARRYFRGNGDFPGLPCSPLHFAVLNRNVDGFKVFLWAMKEFFGRQEQSR